MNDSNSAAVFATLLLWLAVGCSTPQVDSPSNFESAASSPAGHAASPPCELWPTLEPPADFDAVCSPMGEPLLGHEAAMWSMINADRADHRTEANQAAPIGYDCVVAQVARLHAYDMCVSGVFAHVLDGRDPGDRLSDHLDWQLGDELASWAENISWHYSLQQAEDDFVEGEPPCDQELGGHRLTILNRDLTHVGVGFCRCALEDTGNFYLVQDFTTYDEEDMAGGNPYCGW